MKRPAEKRGETKLDQARINYTSARTLALAAYEKECAKALAKFRRAIRPTWECYRREHEKLQLVIWKEVNP